MPTHSCPFAPHAPQDAIRSFVVESMRVLKPGGVVAFVDNNPKWVHMGGVQQGGCKGAPGGVEAG